MKKKIFVIAQVSVLLLFVLCASAQAVGMAKIVEIKGDVLMMRAGARNWQIAKIGMEFGKGDKIRATANSSAIIIFDDNYNNSVKLNPNTEINFESMDPYRIFMPTGDMLSRINDLDAGSNFEVRTPTAVCGVLGTSWRTIYTAQGGGFEVQVFESQVRIVFADGTSREFLLSEGDKGLLDNDEFKQTFLSQADQNEWDEFVSILAGLAADAGQNIGGGTDIDDQVDEIEEGLPDDVELENPASPI